MPPVPEVGPRSDSPAQGEFLAAVSQARERVRRAADRPEDLVGELAAAVSALVEAPATVALAQGAHLVRRYATPGAPLPPGTVVVVQGTVCGEALVAGQPVRIDDLDDLAGTGPDAAFAAASAVACCPGSRSLLSVPIVDGTDVIGVVAVASRAPGWFDRMAEHAVTLVAQAAAPHLATYPPAPFGAGAAPAAATPRRDGPEQHPGGIPSPAPPHRPAGHSRTEGHPADLLPASRRGPDGDPVTAPVPLVAVGE